MPRPRKKMLKEYRSMDTKSEALWALVAVIAMVVIMEVYAAWV